MNGINDYYCFPSKVANMSHLTLAQRYTISEMKKAGYSQTAISDVIVIGKDKSVVSRELKKMKIKNRIINNQTK